MTHRHAADRHLAAAAWVSHGLRNLLAPTQLRLDAWLLRGPDAAVGGDELGRMRGMIQDVLQVMDGLDLLRLAPTDQVAVGTTSWPDALRALLSCISAGTPPTFELKGDADDVAQRSPKLAITHLLVDLALAAQRTALGAKAKYSVGMESNLVTVRATFGPVAADLTESLALAVQQIAEEALVPAGKTSGTGVLVEVTEDLEVVCHVDMPISIGADSRSPVTVSGERASSFSILCIDDNDHLLDALEARLRQADGFTHFHRSRSVAEALAKLEHAEVSLVLVDVHLSTAHDPLVSIKSLRTRSPRARIALFSGSADPDLMQRAMEHGADGFVFKGMTSHVLIDAIVRLARGERVWAADAD